jgi:hypothetical protein
MKVLASLLLLASVAPAHAQRGDIQDAADDVRAFWDRPNEPDDETLARRIITEEFPVFATACNSITVARVPDRPFLTFRATCRNGERFVVLTRTAPDGLLKGAPFVFHCATFRGANPDCQ